MGQFQQQSYPHSPEAYGTPVSSPPPNYAQPQQQHQYNMDNHPQQPGMAHPEQHHMMPEKQQHVTANAYQNGQGSKFGNKWTFGFWDCFSPFSLCCMTCWCPCIVFGKTYDREHGISDSSGVNMMCCAWYCAAMLGANSCVQCIFRGQMRERYNIDSSPVNDFAASFCCPCCSLMQEEKESLVRKTGVDPTTQQQYHPVGGMTYP